MTNGKTTRATHGMFNSAFATGWDNGGDMTSAAACTINTVQQNTGLTIDHFVVVDFAGFQQMVNSIGGVPMCIPTRHELGAGRARRSRPGFQTLDGPTALAYARARKGPGVGDGSDTNRIGNQQKLIAAMVREVLSRDVLTNPQKLISFLSAATGSLTTDSGMSIGNMTGLAYNLRNISSGNITFMTIPFAAAKSDPNRVEWTSEADAVWANMVERRPRARRDARRTGRDDRPGSRPPRRPRRWTPVAPVDAGPGGDEEGRPGGVQRRRHDGRLLRHGFRRADLAHPSAELRARLAGAPGAPGRRRADRGRTTVAAHAPPRPARASDAAARPGRRAPA